LHFYLLSVIIQIDQETSKGETEMASGMSTEVIEQVINRVLNESRNETNRQWRETAPAYVARAVAQSELANLSRNLEPDILYIAAKVRGVSYPSFPKTNFKVEQLDQFAAQIKAKRGQ